MNIYFLPSKLSGSQKCKVFGQMKLPNFVSPCGESSSKSASFGLSKLIFFVKNHPHLSECFFHWRIIVEGHIFLWKWFIDNFNFWTTLFLKSFPIFDKLSPGGDTDFGNFGQKPFLLGPRQLARQKVNIHYGNGISPSLLPVVLKIFCYIWYVMIRNTVYRERFF